LMYHLSSKSLVFITIICVTIYIVVGYAVGALGRKVSSDLVKQACRVERKIQRRTGEPMSVECQNLFKKRRR
jgi:hypothetical protein